MARTPRSMRKRSQARRRLLGRNGEVPAPVRPRTGDAAGGSTEPPLPGGEEPRLPPRS